MSPTDSPLLISKDTSDKATTSSGRVCLRRSTASFNVGVRWGATRNERLTRSAITLPAFIPSGA
jgi:hypothetical protein